MEPQIQRWSAKRKVELLLSLIKGERKLVDVCREHDLKQSEVEAWMETFMKAGERGLKAKSDDESAVHEKEVKELRTKVGELVLKLDARTKWEALDGRDETAFCRCRARCEQKAPSCRSRGCAGGSAWRGRRSTTGRRSRRRHL